MRDLPITMTKAAKNRLALLRNREALPLPVGDDLIRPFGIRFSELVLCVTYEGKDVAYVPDAYGDDGKSFPLKVMLPKNDTIDMAFRRMFGTLTHHLDGVGRILAQEKREEKLRSEEIKAEQERKLLERPETMTPFLGESRSRSFPGITKDDFVRSNRHAKSDGAFRVSLSDYRPSTLSFAHMSFELEFGDDGSVKFKDEDTGISSEKIAEEVRLRLERVARLEDTAQTIADLKASLPPASKSITKFVMGPPQETITKGRGRIDLSDDLAITFSHDTVSVEREGSSVFSISTLNRSHMNEGYWVPKKAMDCFTESWGYVERRRPFEEIARGIGDEGLLALGSLWINHLEEQNPNIDFSLYGEADVEGLIAKAEGMDDGYGF